MDGRVTLVRADGARAVVDVGAARAILDTFWELGLLVGAATAAASMTDALRSTPYSRKPVHFTEREGEALRRATAGHVTWSPA